MLWNVDTLADIAIFRVQDCVQDSQSRIKTERPFTIQDLSPLPTKRDKYIFSVAYACGDISLTSEYGKDHATDLHQQCIAKKISPPVINQVATLYNLLRDTYVTNRVIDDDITIEDKQKLKREVAMHSLFLLMILATD